MSQGISSEKVIQRVEKRRMRGGGRQSREKRRSSVRVPQRHPDCWGRSQPARVLKNNLSHFLKNQEMSPKEI